MCENDECHFQPLRVKALTFEMHTSELCKVSSSDSELLWLSLDMRNEGIYCTQYTPWLSYIYLPSSVSDSLREYSPWYSLHPLWESLCSLSLLPCLKQEDKRLKHGSRTTFTNLLAKRPKNQVEGFKTRPYNTLPQHLQYGPQKVPHYASVVASTVFLRSHNALLRW